MDTNSVTLGARLQAIASLIKEGSIVGDIGTDHAYLPVYLIQQGIIQKAIGIDVHEGPYQSAVQTVRTSGLHDVIDVRKGDGLIPLQPGEVNFLTIAGMGGNTILQILAQSQGVMNGISEMVLQPQGAEGKVRRELLNNGWKIKEELLVEEDKRIYGLIHFTRTDGLDREDVERYVHDFLDRIRIRDRDRDRDSTETQRKAPLTENGNIERADIQVKDKENDGNENNIIQAPNKKMFTRANILKNTIEKFFWEVGPLIINQGIEREVNSGLLQHLIAEQIQRLEKVVDQMQHTVRQEVEDRVTEMREEIKVWEMIHDVCIRKSDRTSD